MNSRRTKSRPRLGSTAYSPAQLRILSAALELFATHGVSGTSLQMIADSLGVTKAAIYHKFKAKDDIVLAVTEAELCRLEGALESARAEGNAEQARKVLLHKVIELSVERRGFVRILQNDPVVIRFIGEHEPFREFMSELYRTLLDKDDDVVARVSAALFTGAIAGATVSPLVDDIDAATLAATITELTSRMLNIAD